MVGTSWTAARSCQHKVASRARPRLAELALHTSRREQRAGSPRTFRGRPQRFWKLVKRSASVAAAQNAAAKPNTMGATRGSSEW
jgi:hypothetical protein